VCRYAAEFPPLSRLPSGLNSAFHRYYRAAPPTCTPSRANLSSRALSCCPALLCQPPLPWPLRRRNARSRELDDKPRAVPPPPCWHRARASSRPLHSYPRACIDHQQSVACYELFRRMAASVQSLPSSSAWTSMYVQRSVATRHVATHCRWPPLLCPARCVCAPLCSAAQSVGKHVHHARAVPSSLTRARQ
jgi:hypothetical protein